jgi:hypothetical protein
MDLTRIRFVAATALCLALAPAVSAQERPAEFDDYVLPGWTFTPGVSLSGMWDSNVALSARAAETGRTAGDQLLVFVPFGQVSLRSARTDFSAGYRGYLRRYREVDQLNGYDQRAMLTLRHLVTPRLTWIAQNEYTEAPTTDQVELNGVPFAHIGSRSNRLGTGLEGRLTKYTSLNVRYENTWTSFDGLEGFVSGGTIHTGSAALRRRLSERIAFGVEGRIRRSDLNRLESRVKWFQDAGATFDYRITEHVTVAVAAGLSHLRDNRLDQTRNAPYYRLELNRDTERATLGIAFEQSYTPSFSFSGSNDSQELRGFVRMPFSRNRFYVQSTGLWRRSDPFFADEIRLDTFITSNTFGYSATRWLRAEMYHAYSLQDSIITGGEVDRHRVGAQIVVSQPMRIR